MKAIQDQVDDKNIRVFRRYGIRSTQGIEQPQEEVITYVLHEDPTHNYTVQLPGEDPDSWWLIASITNPLSLRSEFAGHTPIYQTPPHLSAPVDDVKLISKVQYEKVLAEIDDRILGEVDSISKVHETHVDPKLQEKEKLLKELKDTGELSKKSLVAFLEKFV